MRPTKVRLNFRDVLFQSLAILLPIVLFASAVRAQVEPLPKLNLEDAVEKALATNPLTKLTASGLRTAEARIKEAKTGKKPLVEFSQSLVRSNNPVFVFGSLLEQGRFGASNFAIDSLNHPNGLFNFRSQVNAQLPIFDQRQTRSRISQAEISKTQSEFQAELVRQQLRFDVIRSYYGTVLHKEMLKVSQDSVRSAEANRKKAGDLVDVGMTTNADFFTAEVELANAKQELLVAESAIKISVAALNLALGEEPDLERELIGDLREIYFPAEEQEALIRIALEKRADYQKAQLSIQNSREQSKSIANQKLPSVSAFGNIGYSSSYRAIGSSDYTVGISLNYTLFDAGRKARIAQATEEETVAELEKEKLANQIRFEVIRALQNYKTSRAKIQVSIKSIAQAEEALRIIQDRYRFGLTTFNEVLRAESALVSSKHNLLNARYEYYISYASLLLATGRLTDVRAFQ